MTVHKSLREVEREIKNPENMGFTAAKTV